ncbi:MAG: LacI family transcriptional regulator [Fimbriimonadaceae bacterium]|jgi:DNA-binding LacI/PurR family transcriptional regulator|nr:LacI family transcriptional regulator [Fimbriimonadaceae bacterium]
MRTTLKDVALLAGVSVQTASHVLAKNPTARISASTRAKVEQAALDLKYSPNRYAQAMKGGKTNVVGILMPLDRPHANYLRFLNAIHSESRKSGKSLMIFGLDTANAQNWEGELPPMWPVDGLISIDSGRLLKVFREDPRNDQIPLAILGREWYSNTDSVSWNLKEAAQLAVKDMVDKGSQSIVYLTPEWMIEPFPNEQRRSGYEAELAERGLRPNIIGAADESPEAGELAISQLLKADPTIDGILCLHDMLAFGAVSACRKATKEIPADVQIWGCHNMVPPEAMSHPLSTLNAPIEACVSQAWTWLCERMSGEAPEHREKLFAMEHIRRSTSR